MNKYFIIFFFLLNIYLIKTDSDSKESNESDILSFYEEYLNNDSNQFDYLKSNEKSIKLKRSRVSPFVKKIENLNDYYYFSKLAKKYMNIAKIRKLNSEESVNLYLIYNAIKKFKNLNI